MNLATVSNWRVLPAVIESVLRVRSREEFLRWAHAELQNVLPHLVMTCGTVRISERGMDIRPVLHRDVRTEPDEGTLLPDEEMLHMLLAKWRKERKPQLFEPGVAVGRGHEAHHGFNIAVHGVLDPMSGNSTFFSFSRILERLTSRHCHLLELLVPHMHVALTRILGRAEEDANESRKGGAFLTKRQHEVLQLISQGAGNKEIAALLHLSEHTVRHHLEHIFAKFEVRNRAQAVAKSLNVMEGR